MSPVDSHRQYRIGEVAVRLGLSVDTLRYYEKIGLLPPVSRTPSGIRFYDAQDLSRLRFIQRAKSMNFTLEEIGQLLEMRKDPQHARKEVRELTHHKLNEVSAQMEALKTLHHELTLLVNLCQGAEKGCPIIDDLDNTPGD